MRILKDLECTQIVQLCKGNHTSSAHPGGVHPPMFLQRVRIYLIPKDLGNPVMQKSV